MAKRWKFIHIEFMTNHMFESESLWVVTEPWTFNHCNQSKTAQMVAIHVPTLLGLSRIRHYHKFQISIYTRSKFSHALCLTSPQVPRKRYALGTTCILGPHSVACSDLWYCSVEQRLSSYAQFYSFAQGCGFVQALARVGRGVRFVYLSVRVWGWPAKRETHAGGVRFGRSVPTWSNLVTCHSHIVLYTNKTLD